MTALTEDRPLVTFALFAYNQEEYVREAVEGAFAQTYEPLEIILSDDCSSDGTFEIMQEMAAAYEGPHDVRARRNAINFGTALHVGSVASEMRGELLVVAAGDDISYPERTDVLVSAWRDAGFPVGTVHSAMTLMGAESREEKGILGLRHGKGETIDLEWFLRNRRLPFLAPSCAYTRELFTHFPPMLGGSVIEDSVLACRSMLIGESIPVAYPLVCQRRPAVSSGRGYTIDDPQRWNVLIRSKLVARLTRLQDIAAVDTPLTSSSIRYQKMTSAEIRALSRFVMTERSRKGPLYKVAILVQIFLFYPSAAGLIRRLYFAIGSVNWSECPAVKLLIALRKAILRTTKV